MATANKSAITLQASASNAAAAAATGTGVDLTTALGESYVVGKITNGATAPTIGCDFVLEVSNDNAAWFEWHRATAGTTANAVYQFPVDLPESVMYVRSKFTGNTGQAVTVECVGAKYASAT